MREKIQPILRDPKTVDPEHVSFLPPGTPHSRAGSGSPRTGVRSPDEILQALLAGIPPQDCAGHGGRG